MSVLEKAREQLLSHGSWSVDPPIRPSSFGSSTWSSKTVKDGSAISTARSSPAPSRRSRAQFASQAWRRSTRNVMRTSAPRTSSMSSATRITFAAGGAQFNGDDGAFWLPGELTIKGVTRRSRSTVSSLAASLLRTERNGSRCR